MSICAEPSQTTFHFSVYAVEIAAAYHGARRPLLIAITGQYKRPADAILSRLVGFDHQLLKRTTPPLALPVA